MPEITIKINHTENVNIDVWCSTCGFPLKEYSTVNGTTLSVSVDLCPKCIKEQEKKIIELENKILEMNKN
jgi:hypothetical protein